MPQREQHLSEIDQDAFEDRIIDRRTFLAGAAGGVLSLGALSDLAAAAATAAGPRRGGILTAAFSDATPRDVLDPLPPSTFTGTAASGVIFEPLVRLDENLRPRPWLAESWEHSKDVKTWIFRLRPGITFSDGSPLTPQDVIYSVRRNLDPKFGSPQLGNLGPVLKPDGIKAVNPRTVRFDLVAPHAFIPDALGTRQLRIVKDGTTDFTRPVGTGPFVVTDFRPGQLFSATRNPHYWQDGKPYLDGLQITNIPEAAAKLQALLTDQVQFIDSPDYALIPTIRRSNGHKTIVLKSWKIVEVVIDVRQKPFNDVRVRQALKLAVDPREVIRTVYQGEATLGYNMPIPEGDAFFDASLKSMARHEPDRAKALLKSAGYKDGITHELIIAPLSAGVVEFAQVIKEQAAKAGFRFNLRQWPVSSYYTSVAAHKPLYVINSARRAASEVFTSFYTTGAVSNGTHMSSRALDRAVQRARQTADFQQQKKYYSIAEQIVAKQGGSVNPAFANLVYGASERVQGVRVTFVSIVDFTNAWLG